MIDDCINTARDIIKARLAKDHELMNSELRSLRLDYANRGIHRSSMYVKKLQTVGKSHLEVRAQIVFDTLEQNLIGPGFPSPTLNQKLKIEFTTHIDIHVQLISEVLEKLKGNDHQFGTINLNNSKSSLVSEYHAKIDSLCRKLANEENKPQHAAMSIDKQVNISGTGHNIQVGDHNVQEFHSAITKIQAAIDASQSTPEQKAEAKSLLRKFLESPVAGSILGNAAGQLVRGLMGP